MIRLAAWAYGFLAAAFLLVMFTTSSFGLMFGCMFGAALSIGRGLYWRDVANGKRTRPESLPA